MNITVIIDAYVFLNKRIRVCIEVNYNKQNSLCLLYRDPLYYVPSNIHTLDTVHIMKRQGNMRLLSLNIKHSRGKTNN